MIERPNLQPIIDSFKLDSESVYSTWFVNNEERLKAFRSIRAGIRQVVDDIRDGTFPNDYKGSSLEFVITCISEQKQVFAGASHPFYWKPKLRIPDIYENESNKAAFGAFLEACLKATNEKRVLDEVIRLDSRSIKGLGPAVANILYFLHPTLFPPFNTAIVNGYNRLFGEKRKLGSWSEYLAMREVMLDVNRQYRHLLSSDLGAIAGLLFELGSYRIQVGDEHALSEEERQRIEKALSKRHNEVVEESTQDSLHTEMQAHLLRIGNALGYDVACASNDQSRYHAGTSLGSMCMKSIPSMGVDAETEKTIRLIDVLWFEKNSAVVAAAFEVEKSTSIYSGMLRLMDLHHAFSDRASDLYIVIPNNREKEVRFQMNRPGLKAGQVMMQYILFNDLTKHCEALCKFGDSKDILKKIAIHGDGSGRI